MRILLFSFLAVFLVACSLTPPPPPPRSWSEHMRVATAEEERAEQHERAAAAHAELADRPNAYQCGDLVLQDQLRSGTERIGIRLPCWNPEDEQALRQEWAAIELRKRARGERQAGGDLIRAEVAACRNIPESEREHSVFDHRSAIVEVIPHYESTEVRGAHVVFSQVAGLSEDWIRQDIACQQARYQTRGRPPRMRNDPSLVSGAEVTVTTEPGRFLVSIETEDDETGAEVLARARDLLSSRTARR